MALGLRAPRSATPPKIPTRRPPFRCALCAGPQLTQESPPPARPERSCPARWRNRRREKKTACIYCIGNLGIDDSVLACRFALGGERETASRRAFIYPPAC